MQQHDTTQHPALFDGLMVVDYVGRAYVADPALGESGYTFKRGLSGYRITVNQVSYYRNPEFDQADNACASMCASVRYVLDGEERHAVLVLSMTNGKFAPWAECEIVSPCRTFVWRNGACSDTSESFKHYSALIVSILDALVDGAEQKAKEYMDATFVYHDSGFGARFRNQNLAIQENLTSNTFRFVFIGTTPLNEREVAPRMQAMLPNYSSLDEAMEMLADYRTEAQQDELGLHLASIAIIARDRALHVVAS